MSIVLDSRMCVVRAINLRQHAKYETCHQKTSGHLFPEQPLSPYDASSVLVTGCRKVEPISTRRVTTAASLRLLLPSPALVRDVIEGENCQEEPKCTRHVV